MSVAAVVDQPDFGVQAFELAVRKSQQARDQLGLTWKYVAEFETQAERMINETLAEGEFRKVCDEIRASPTETATDRSRTIAGNRAQALDLLFLDAYTNATIRGTRWAGYQAIAEYLDHAAPVNGKTVGDKAVNRALRSIAGSVVDLKERALSVLAA